MALIAGTHYDPTTAANINANALSAMTAFDTTNLRLTFTAPPTGNVLVRIRAPLQGSTTLSQCLLGVLQSSTVIARQACACGSYLGSTAAYITLDATFVVTGLSGSYTWDAAYAVQVVDGSANDHFKYGGPNDTTTNNAFGGFSFEIWEAAGLLGGKIYDPGTAVSASTAADLAMTAFDTTNLRLAITAPASGNILVRMRAPVAGATTTPQILMGVLESSTVRGRIAPTPSKNYIGAGTAGLATTFTVYDAQFLITGLTPASSHTYDAAYGVETLIASTGVKYGGPNDASGADAYGGFAYEIWAA